MTMKEAPLIKAMKHQGPLPNFFFTNPYICGFMPMVYCAIAGGVALLIVTAGHGGVSGTQVLGSFMMGSLFATGIGFIVMALTASRYVNDPESDNEERKFHTAMIHGSMIGIVSITLLYFILWATLHEWLSTIRYMQ